MQYVWSNVLLKWVFAAFVKRSVVIIMLNVQNYNIKLYVFAV